ncbi:hypothetical protein KVT40_004350 [Elsinoe batatas]|uniref:Uncharacterized protein n=1 Tax=Elsinoe batatas TaxID=2601811 RepID=A0A8K0L3J6_9PEZI|nr:hypothetical protein KVT40_004350 [Elsinoe batatas]
MSRVKKRHVRCWWCFPPMACDYDLTKDLYHIVGIPLLGLCRWDMIALWRWCCKERPDRVYLLNMPFLLRTDGYRTEVYRGDVLGGHRAMPRVGRNRRVRGGISVLTFEEKRTSDVRLLCGNQMAGSVILISF